MSMFTNPAWFSATHNVTEKATDDGLRPGTMLVWSRYILTSEYGASYLVVATDDDFSAAEFALAKMRVGMWGFASGFIARQDSLSRSLVEADAAHGPIQTLAYPEAL